MVQKNQWNKWFFEKTNRVDKSLANLTKRKWEKAKIYQIRDEKVISQQTPLTFRELLANASKTYILENWKIRKK
jgi:hypothetical protein